MKKILIILSNFNILGSSLFSLQNIDKLNSSLNSNLSKNNINTYSASHTISDITKDNNYVYDLDKVNIFHKTVEDTLHTFNHNLYFLNYGAQGFSSLDDYFTKNSVVYNKNFKIISSIGTKKFKEINAQFSYPISKNEFLGDMNKTITLTKETWENGGDSALSSIADVQMKLVDDKSKKIVIAQITSSVENNNAWYNVYNEIQV